MHHSHIPIPKLPLPLRLRTLVIELADSRHQETREWWRHWLGLASYARDPRGIMECFAEVKSKLEPAASPPMENHDVS